MTATGPRDPRKRSAVTHDAPASLMERVTRVLERDASVPVFSAIALQLLEIATQDDLEMRAVTEMVQLDPGLTSKYLRLAGSVAFGGQLIDNVHDALMRIGLREVRKLASTISMMDVLSLFRREKGSTSSNLHLEVDWEMFWLHSLLSARLAESLAHEYRPVSGREYLAGLLHDAGKIFLQRHFPLEFTNAMNHALKHGCGMFEAEKALFDITHAEIGGRLCEKWKLHKEVCRAVRFHHEPDSPSPLNEDADDPRNQHFLAACVCVANSLASLARANIQGVRSFDAADIESLPEWTLLQEFIDVENVDLDVFEELQKAQEAIQILALEEPL
ncbi:MAG: HDOD domain-containing protein [Verrucomicrobia bacterium]|nr:HDOD domain-containing protein [Verrucomicrobiota bacterium]